MNTILIVDDDPNILQVVDYSLKKAGFTVVTADNGKKALESFKIEQPDLIVLDILMPEIDGIEVCKEIRKTSNIPIIFLTSVDDELDRIVGLEIGGDDYITKPFSPRELTARVKAVIRRCLKPSSPQQKERIINYYPLRIDLEKYRIFSYENEIELTVTEFNIIKTLASYPGRVYSRELLMTKSYPEDTFVSDRTIDSHIKRIRSKFKKTGFDPIDTVHGLGYRISRQPE